MPLKIKTKFAQLNYETTLLSLQQYLHVLVLGL